MIMKIMMMMMMILIMMLIIIITIITATIRMIIITMVMLIAMPPFKSIREQILAADMSSINIRFRIGGSFPPPLGIMDSSCFPYIIRVTSLLHLNASCPADVTKRPDVGFVYMMFLLNDQIFV